MLAVLVGALGAFGVLTVAWLWTPAPVRAPAPDPLVAAAKPLVTGEVANFILYDVPEPAPAVTFADERGALRTLADFHGQAVLLNFWATWCVPCKREMPSLDRLEAALGSPAFQVVPLSQDRTMVNKVRAFYDEQSIAALPLYIDQSGASQRAFGITGLPSTILIDADGKVVGRMVGPAEWDSPEAIALLKHFADR